jgi:glutamate/tyrosine decarboxylase-like PLP-dependent enzyme
MNSDLRLLEEASRKLDIDSGERENLLRKTIQYSNRFLKEIDDLPVYVANDEPVKDLMDLHFEENGRSIEVILEILESAVDRTGINPAAPGHLGYVPGGGVFTTALGDFLAAVTNRYAGIYYANPGAVVMEDLCIRWMAQLIGYPENHAGNLTSGGSIATLTALTAARDHHNITPENVRNQVIYLTQQAHHCIHKALRIAALDYAQLRIVPMNEAFEMDPVALQSLLDQDKTKGLVPFLIVGSAGSTDLGIIDPLEKMGQLARSYDCWFHVDGAYGGLFIMVDELKQRLAGLALSDSVVLDPHKSLFLSYGTGAVLIKNRAAALKTHYYRANYMQDAEGDFAVLNPADVSPELTKHFRGLRMWLSLQYFGIAPFRATLEEKLALAKYFYKEVKGLGFEVGPEPTLSVCLFRWKTGEPQKDNFYNQKLIERILQSGKIFISSTTLDDIYWLRICVMVFRTHKEHIDRLLALLQKIRTEN